MGMEMGMEGPFGVHIDSLNEFLRNEVMPCYELLAKVCRCLHMLLRG